MNDATIEAQRTHVFFTGMARQSAERDLRDALQAMIVELNYSPADVSDEIQQSIELIGEEMGMEYPYVKANVEFYGEEDEQHANEERGRAPVQFAWERE